MPTIKLLWSIYTLLAYTRAHIKFGVLIPLRSFPLHLMLLQCADNFDNLEHVKCHHACNILNTGKISMQYHVVMLYV